MRHVEESSNKNVLEFATPQDSIGGQQVNWLLGVVAPAFRVGRRKHNYPTVRRSQLAVHTPVTFGQSRFRASATPCL
ncbi:MAG: hypothetical protein QOH35_667 [Acidobacteriaceae bacterium]|jgi:hypothetical protein|nr:hypothetical protein [Acidobacteriaceae bacterium]MEA2539301.1 hypothetical protein [Acidobacteriaceae bacterium]